ncbi:hypothetical protein WN51_05742 [Melipona quadrifasciata]|uniref:Uncharacterized protein n=1 Tax=Melipona quadrifasciata TaxID=166423 RepID=A0A0M9A765_9HYME|nr:hypothetical protein WN51_05742 [Melipona quadrifasciata]
MSYRAKKRTETETKNQSSKKMFFCVWFFMYTNIPFCKCVCRRTYFDKSEDRDILLDKSDDRSIMHR